MKRQTLLLVSGTVTALLTGCNSTDLPQQDQSSSHITSLSGWQLIWSDEFDGDQINTDKWSHEVNCWGGGNGEQQCYVEDEKNSFVENGLLTIRVEKGDTTGPDSVEGSDGYGETTTTLPYSSARLRTMNKGDWKYGRFEIRAKLPSGQGTWPAIWMLPTDYVYGGWAASGEIDIMEAVNLHTSYTEDGETRDENRVHGTLHFGKAWPNNVSSGVEYDFGDPSINPADGFHTYAIEWQEGEIRWYVDDVHYATQTMDGWWSHYQDEEGNWVSGPDDAPYNQKFHLILNVAMGGSWPASVNDTGIDATIEQAEMQVDYVRVYQCSLDPETGAGCTNGTSAEAVAENGVTEPDFPSEVDLSDTLLSLFGSGSLLEGFQLNGWDDAGNDSRSISENMIDISIVDNGNAYIEKLGDPLDMSDFVGGEMALDLSRVSGDASALSVKMDSGYPNLAPIDINAADLPAIDDWKSYRFPISDFVAAGTNAFSIASISNPIVFEPVNNAALHFQVNNIRFYKPITLSDSQSVIDGFTLDGYTSDASDTRTVDENGVIDLQFSGTGNAFLTAEPALDMSNYADWVMKFDLKLVDPGTNTDILVKMDSGWPNVSDLTLSSTTTGLPADNDWYSYQIPVADFIAADNTFSPGSKFDITNVTNPIVLEGSGGEDLHVQIKNIRFEAN